MADKRETRMDQIHAVKSGPGSADAALPGYEEPWVAGRVPDRADGAWEIRDASGLVVVEFYGSEVMEEDEPELARRIAACVNVCRNISTRDLECFARLDHAEEEEDREPDRESAQAALEREAGAAMRPSKRPVRGVTL